MKNSELFTILCDCLAFTDNNDQLRATLSAPDFPWEAFIESASQHLVTPALHYTLEEKGVLESIPRDAADYLEATLILNRSRNEELQSDLLKIGEQFNIHGITPVALKGAACLIDETYPDPGMRILSDLDLVVSKNKLEECIQILEALGYRTQDAYKDDLIENISHHYYPMMKSDGISIIELHIQPLHEGYQDMMPIDHLEKNCQVLNWQGTSIAIPSITLRVLHNIVHTHLADGNHQRKQVSLRQLYDYCTICRADSSSIDWAWISTQFKNKDQQKALENYLLLSNNLLSTPIPENTFRQDTQDDSLRQLLWKIDHTTSPTIQKTLSALNSSLVNIIQNPKKIRRLLKPQWLSYKIKSLVSPWKK